MTWSTSKLSRKVEPVQTHSNRSSPENSFLASMVLRSPATTNAAISENQ
jgi:hypothetical protein